MYILQENDHQMPTLLLSHVEFHLRTESQRLIDHLDDTLLTYHEHAHSAEEFRNEVARLGKRIV